MSLLNDTMGSADCDKFRGFMTSVYLDHKRKTRVISHQEYLRLAEIEYRTLYRAGKWTASRNDPTSGFFVDHGGRGYGRGESRDRGRGRGDGGQGGGHNTNRWSRLSCHNYGRLGHISCNCWSPGGDSEGQGLSNEVSGSGNNEGFSGIYKASTRRPPQ